jgi:hypothetical protein
VADRPVAIAGARLYQAVTLGAKRFPTDNTGALVKGAPRHPIIEDDVVIYAGATVLGRITIGKGSTIGGNVWLTHSVPAESHVSQAQTRHDRAESHAPLPARSLPQTTGSNSWSDRTGAAAPDVSDRIADRGVGEIRKKLVHATAVPATPTIRAETPATLKLPGTASIQSVSHTSTRQVQQSA